MNKDSSARPSLRQLLRERLCDQAATLVVLSVALAFSGWFMFKAGLQFDEGLLTTLGGLGLGTPWVLAWILHDPDAPKCTDTSEPSEIGRMTDEEFDRLLDEVERQARMPFPPAAPVAASMQSDDGEFAQIVRAALDELPEFVQDELRRGNLAVTVSDYGCEWDAYGLYCGGTAADDGYSHQIMIFRDTLTAHFGDDLDQLRRQVKITVRHEVAHHFGADERRVRELGL